MSTVKILGQATFAALLLVSVGCESIGNKIEAALQEQLEKEANALFEEAAKQYPTYLAVASPFAMTAATQIMAANQQPPGGLQPQAEEPPKIREYEDLTRRIHAMLMETEDAKRCHFPPGMLLKPSRNAACYGPNVVFENHPDSLNATTDGSLPHGDTGLWTALDARSGQACAAEQLNAGLDSVGQLTSGALMGLAGMICTARVNDIAIDQPEIDLLAQMNALGMPNVTFTKAVLRHPGEKQFSYALSFDIAGDHKHRVAIEMEHAPGDVTTAYSGKVWYRISDDQTRFNCPEGEDTRNGSLVYDRTAASLAVQVKGGVYCGKDADGRNADGKLDPALKRTPQSNQGWQNMFDILSAKFDPISLAGDYSYIWQAGNHDGNSRAFNLHISGDNDGVTGGDAFFGYGKDIGESDGSIQGFICNWAGPGSNHILKPFAQHQKISKSGEDKFLADVSEIAYAPTNSCGYDGLGTFTFDSDGDGMVDTDPGTPFVSELLGVTDGDSNGLLDEIEATGFVLPKK